MTNRRVVKIPCTRDNFFRYYVELLNPIVKLRKRELDVWAQLLYHNDKYKGLDDEIKFKMVFDYATKAKIANTLDISMDVLNNNLSELRKRKIIVDNKIPKGYQVHLEENEYSLTFNFKAKDGKAGTSQNGMSRRPTADALGSGKDHKAVETGQS